MVRLSFPPHTYSIGTFFDWLWENDVCYKWVYHNVSDFVPIGIDFDNAEDASAFKIRFGI